MMKNKYNLVKIISYLIFLIVVVIVFVFMVNNGFLHPNVEKYFESPCDPPCWYDVTPGITTLIEFNDMVDSLPYYEQSDTFWRGSDWRNYSDIFTMQISKSLCEIGVEFYMKGDVVGGIAIYSRPGLFGQNLLGFDLKDAIDTFGEPDRLVFGAGCRFDNWCTGIYLFYPQISVVVKIDGEMLPPDVEIKEDLPVRYILYLDTDDYLHQAISNQCVFDNLSIKWFGYGPVHFDHSFDYCDDD